MDTKERRQELARLVRTARVRRFGGVAAAERAADLSRGPWVKVEKGQAVSSLTYGRIEDVLDWQAGSVERFLEGGPPPGPPGVEAVPLGSGVDPEVLAELAQAEPATLEAVRAVLRAAKRH